MGTFINELVQVGLYKRTQGRVTRQVTFFSLALIFAIAAWRLHETLRLNEDASALVFYGLPLLFLAAGAWVSYRIVNLPRFADFLIAVEAEMNKVSWPSTDELIRNSAVVIFVIFFLAFLLFGFDQIWMFLFQAIGVLRSQ